MTTKFPNSSKINSTTIDDFRAKLTGGGARPNLFEVELAFPPGLGEKDAVDKGKFMVKAANLPASNINVIDVPFRGRNLKIAGDRTFDVWTITVINDTDFMIRNAFERWMNAINKHDNATGEVTPGDYQTDMYVNQLGRAVKGAEGTIDGAGTDVPILRKYKFHGVFPTNVSAIELSYDQTDSIEEFTIDLQVQWWDVFDANNSNVFNTGKEKKNTQIGTGEDTDANTTG
tara:strand:- start:256 stop:945 length:690 start_codon:yes stop_codon:yes gene_type:complete